MKKRLIALATAGLLAAVSSTAMAKNMNAPGQQMHAKGSVEGSPGASGYAPGHLKKSKVKTKNKNGVSIHVPRRTTTGMGVRTRTGIRVNGDIR